VRVISYCPTEDSWRRTRIAGNHQQPFIVQIPRPTARLAELFSETSVPHPRLARVDLRNEEGRPSVNDPQK